MTSIFVSFLQGWYFRGCLTGANLHPKKEFWACVTRDWLLCPYAPVRPFTQRTLLNNNDTEFEEYQKRY